MLASLLTIGFYLAATSRLSFIQGSHSVHSSRNRQLFIGFALFAIVLHTGLLYHSTHGDTGMINLSFFNAISMIAWLLAILVVLVTWLKGLDNLAIILFPMAALSVGLSSYFPATRFLPEHLPLGVTFHILVSIFAYSLLSLAALQALFMAVQDYYLRHKKPLKVMRHLPPLQVMETLLFQFINIGFVLLTLSLLSGIFFLQDIFAQHLVHKTLLSILAWLVFAGLLWGRWQYGWRGRTVLQWILSGFLVLMLAYFGSKLVLELILHR